MHNSQNNKHIVFRYQNIDFDKTDKNWNEKCKAVTDSGSISDEEDFCQFLDKTESTFPMFLDWFYTGFSRN